MLAIFAPDITQVAQQVIEDASAKVAAVPENTVHSAGAALVQMRYLLIEGLRKLQV